jgi:hypothetical protein
MTEQINVGDMLRVYVTFTNAAGVVADPSGVTLTVLKPDGTHDAYTSGFINIDGSVKTIGNGQFRRDVTLTQSGTWRARWDGTGAVTASEPDAWYVVPDTVGT